MKLRLIFAFICLFAFITIQAQTARVQIIHNAPTPTVDIYAGTDKLLDNFVFRTATPFIDVPAGVVIAIGVALDNSQSFTDAIATFNVQFEAGKTYVVVATGIVGGNPGFTLKVFDAGKEKTTNAANTGILFFHGSPDAPVVDIVAGGAPIIDNAAYGDFQGYLEVPAANYELSVTPGADNNTIVAKYGVDMSFWAGNTAVIFASGFLGGGNTPFEPWVALSNGGTFPLKTIQAPATPVTGEGKARIQIIHNAPSPTVDIYAGTAKLLDNFAFRTATPFVEVPAGVTIPIGVALDNSQSSADAIATFPVQFAPNRRYVVVATGIVGGNPGFTLKVFDMGRENASTPDNISLLFFHGSPDAPAVDVVVGGNPIIDNAAYGDFQGYLDLPAKSVNFRLSVTPANDNNTIVASYNADLTWWRGRTAVIFASGFLGGSGPAFEPWVALSNGGTFPLPKAFSLKPENGADDRNKMQTVATELSVFPNPVVGDRLNVSMIMENDTDVQASVINVFGQEMDSRAFGTLSKGEQILTFDTTKLPTGNYFLMLRSAFGIQTVPFVIAQ